MAGAEPAAEHQAREYFDVTNPLLIGHDTDRKRRYHSNRDPCPGPQGRNKSCSQQTGQCRITPSPTAECGKSPPGDDDHIGARCRGYCPERFADDLADDKAGVPQVQLRRDRQIPGCLPVSLAQGIGGPLKHVAALRRRLLELRRRLTGCRSGGRITRRWFPRQLRWYAWCDRLRRFARLGRPYLNL